MEALKYKIIKTERQYFNYCRVLEELLNQKRKSKASNDEIEMLTLLIGKYDQERHTLKDPNPVELLKSLLESHQMKSIELARLLKVSPGLISDILNYKKGLSKETIRILSEKFKLRQEAFNRPYRLEYKGVLRTRRNRYSD